MIIIEKYFRKEKIMGPEKKEVEEIMNKYNCSEDEAYAIWEKEREMRLNCMAMIFNACGNTGRNLHI